MCTVADRKSQNSEPEKKRKGFPPGVSGNPGGRPKKLVEIERMLDAEHRTVENMREVYAKLRELAVNGTLEPKFHGPLVVGEVRKYHAAFMELYLNRVQGPVRDHIDLADAPDEVIAWIEEHLN